MREILFRGKRIDNGEWVFGDLIREPWGYCIQVVTGSGNEYSRKKYAITEKTIGQYTGLKDKNGKLIFEGSIVRYTERRLGGEDVPVTHPVKFDEGGFCVNHYFLNNWLRNGLGGNTKLEGIEAIGNVFDNPEFMKEGADHAT